MSREDQSKITVQILKADGVTPWPGLGTISGNFADRTGGKGTSENAEVWPGAMESKINLGGRQDFDDLTLVRPFFLDRDVPLRGPLMAARGNARAKVTDQPLDADKNTFGAPAVYVGRLTEVDLGDAQASSTDPRMLTLTVAVDGFTA